MTTTSGSDVAYDAFLSYSHAADGKLAPAIQNAVQRFATPWFRLRSLRLFRDQTGLSASPGLWSSIEAALSRASWFVLFASPEAAESEWVAREIMWWLERHGRDRILIVVTGGTFGWDTSASGPGRLSGSALPGPLSGALLEEPRWIDLRWARTSDDLDKRDPRFGEAVADLAATLRNVPKDSLIGEDVRQHRRGRRLATAVTAVLAVLALVVAGLVVTAVRQQAITEAVRAAEAAGQMIVEADVVRTRDPQAAMRLDVAAQRLTPSPQNEAALVQDLTGTFRNTVPGHSRVVDAVAWSQDGQRFATADTAGRVIVHTADAAAAASLPIELGAAVRSLAFSADGTHLAVLLPGRVELIPLADPTGATSTPAPSAAATLFVTPSGEVLVVAGEQLLRLASNGTTATQSLAGAGTEGGRSALSADGLLLATASPTTGVQLWDVGSIPRRLNGLTASAPAGTLLAFDPSRPILLIGSVDGSLARWNITDPSSPTLTGPPTMAVERTLVGLAVDRAGRTAAASIDGSITVQSGAATLSLRAHRTPPFALAFSPSGDQLVSGSLDGSVIFWNTGPSPGAMLSTTAPNGHAGALLTTVAAHRPGGPIATAGNNGVKLWDVLGPGRIVARPGLITVPGAAFSLAFGPDDHTLAVGSTTGHVSLIDVADPARVRDVSVGSSAVFDLEFFPDGRTLAAVGDSIGLELIDVPSGVVSAVSSGATLHSVAITADGLRLIVSDVATNSFEVWDVTAPAHPSRVGSVVNGHDTATVEAMVFTPNGTLISVGREGKIVLTALDGPNGSHELGEIATAERAQTRSDAAALLTLSIAPDGRTLAAAGEEGNLGLWDIADPSRPRPIGAALRELQGQMYGVTFSPDGSTLVAGGQDPRTVAWDLTPLFAIRSSAVDAACRRAGGALSRESWTRLTALDYQDTCTS